MDHTGIIPSMEETLFKPCVEGMDEILVEIADIGLDHALDGGLLQGIPVLSTIAALCKTGLNIRERNLIRQTAIFITSFNDKTIDSEKLTSYRKALESNPKKAEKELGRVVLLLNQSLEEKRSQVLGHFYNSYVRGAISWDKFVELSEVNSRMFMDDYKVLNTIYSTPIKDDADVSDDQMYHIQRLESLGVMLENKIRLVDGSSISYPDTDDRFVVSTLGKTFMNLM